MKTKKLYHWYLEQEHDGLYVRIRNLRTRYTIALWKVSNNSVLEDFENRQTISALCNMLDRVRAMLQEGKTK